MNTNKALNIARLAAEFAVIVVGVLSALAVDQVMERRQERELERELLLGFVENLLTDSADFARLPELALRRASSAELLLLNLAPRSRPGVRVAADLAELGPYETPAGDDALANAWGSVFSASDLDVARGSYTEFSAGGAQRLVRDAPLRRRIHNYYYAVDLNQKYDPRMTEALRILSEVAIRSGLSPSEPSAEAIRTAFVRDSGPLVAALRNVQLHSVVQADIAGRLSERSANLRQAIRDQLR